MYSTFYGLQEKPFALHTDSRFFYKSKIHQDILEGLNSCIDKKERVCLLTGDIGTGKTSIIRYLLEEIDSGYNVGFIANTNFPAEELSDRILSTYNQNTCGNLARSSKALFDYIAIQNRNNKHSVLILDDSQNLSDETAEALHELINECFTRALGISIILSGEPALHEVLKKPKLDSFSKYTDSNFELKNLSQDESANYIRYRIEVAGGPDNLFSDEATNALYKSTGGVPRSMNLLCDSALVYGYVEKSKAITGNIVNKVVNDRKGGRLFPALAKAEVIAKERANKEKEIEILNAEKEAAFKKIELANLDAEQESARLKEEQEGKIKAEMELARLKAEEEARMRADEELAILKAEKEAKLVAEEKQAKLRSDEEAKLISQEQDILIKENNRLEEETRDEEEISQTSDLVHENENIIEKNIEPEVSTPLPGSQTIRKTAGNSSLNPKPKIAAIAIIIVILGFFLFSSDDEELSVPESPITQKDTLKVNELTTQAVDRARADVLKGHQDDDNHDAPKYEAERAKEQAHADVLRDKLEEDSRKNAILDAEQKKTEEKTRKQSVLEAELKNSDEEARKNAELKIEQDHNENAARLKLEQERAEADSVNQQEFARKKKAAQPTAIKKTHVSASKETIKQRESIDLAARTAQLEAKQKEKAYREHIREIQQAEENIQDPFE